jgi:hypothetical protein
MNSATSSQPVSKYRWARSPTEGDENGCVWAIVNRWWSGQMSFDFGEVETVCKFDVGAHCVNG